MGWYPKSQIRHHELNTLRPIPEDVIFLLAGERTSKLLGWDSQLGFALEKLEPELTFALSTT